MGFTRTPYTNDAARRAYYYWRGRRRPAVGVFWGEREGPE